MSLFGIGQKLPVIGKEQELLDAARTGNLPTVVKILTSKQDKGKKSTVGKLTSFLKSVNVNCTDKNGYTALHHASVNGHRDIVEALLRAEAQPGLQDHQHCTPIHLAAWNGNPEIVMQLLSAGADVEYGSTSSVEPVDVNGQNGNGETALHCAAQYGHVAVVDVLLQKSANPSIRNLVGASPLDLAAQYGRLEVVQRILISHPDLAHHPTGSQSPLHLASRNGHRDIVAVLLDNKFDIHTMTEMGTALHEAALHGKLDVVKLLLERGVNVHERDRQGQTVLELLSDHQSQQKTFTDITNEICEFMRQSDDTQGGGLYESLSSCRSGSYKPTAAVKPLLADKPHPSESQSPPSPALKPRPLVDRASPPDKPHQSDTPTPSPSERPQPPSPRISPGPSRATIHSSSPKLDSRSPGDKPKPFPRRSLIQLSPDSGGPTVGFGHAVVPMYTQVNKDSKNDDDRVVSSTGSIADEGPPPLPPRTSVFAPENRALPTLPTVPGPEEPSPEKSPKTMTIPKKPPRHRKSPLPGRRSPVIASVSEVPSPTTEPPSIVTPPAIATSDSSPYSSTQHSMQHSTTQLDQSHSSTVSCDTPPDRSNQSEPPVKSPKPVLPSKTLPAKVDNSVDPASGKQVNQSFYLEMTAAQSKPNTKSVSEVKPQMSERKLDLKPLPDGKVDNYGILFPNLKKVSVESTKKYEFKRSNTSPEESEYIGCNPLSPSVKFQEKQGLLRRQNTAPPAEDSAYMSMSKPKAQNECNEPKDVEIKGSKKENEYYEIAEKSPRSPSSPKENIYAEIGESKRATSIDVDVYSQISDLPTPPVSPAYTSCDDVTKQREVAQDESKGADKPSYLEFVKNRESTPLTPTGYAQPPTPDFPPPSPTTAMLGIELKIQQIDTKRKSKDITTITDDSPVIEGGKTLQEVTSSEVKVTTDTYKVKVTGQRVSSEGVKEAVKANQSEISENVVTVGDKLDITVQETKESSETPKEASTNRSESDSDNSSSSVVEGKVDQTKDTSVISPDSNSIPMSSKKPEIPARKPPVSQKPKSKSDGAKNTTLQTGSESKEEGLQREQSNGTKKPVRRESTHLTELKGSGGPRVDGPGSAGGSPVIMRKKSSTGSNPDLDMFKGLLRGSTVGVPRKAASQFYEDVLRKNKAQSRVAATASRMIAKPGMDKDEEIDIDLVMKSIDVDMAKRATGHESSAFDDAEEWEKIQDIMASFGSSIARESVFIKDFEPRFMQMLAGQGQMVSVGEWLESIEMSQYENAFVANGFDNIDFLDPKVLEEQDLEQIGVLAHDHRQKLLHSTQHLPQLKPIDPECPPPSVEEWLVSLQLLDYLETFRSHGYDTMDKVQSILWELQLRTVLDISMLGHRKRILASLGERKPLERQNSTTKKSLSNLSPEKKKNSPLDINLFKDYTNVKPVSTSEEDIKESSQMAIDSSEDEEVFKKTSGQSIRNSNIHIRPPHLAQTSSPARQWRHKPEMLIKGCCNYTAQYLGSTVVPELQGGTESTKAGITKLKKTAEVLAKIPVILLSISYKGVKFIDAKSKKVICDHEIGNIFCACQDTVNLNFFAYITRDNQSQHHYCHVFCVQSSSLAHDIILTLGESFEVAFQMAMKEKSVEEAMELDRKMSQSDAEADSYSIASKTSTNTV